MIVGIIGLGEVGSAIKKLCKKKHQVYGRSRSTDQLKGKKVDVLHLCYPYSEDFVNLAIANIKELKSQLVINDSSVKPGTTQIIFKKTNIPIVHAPIVGKHPYLYRYLFEMKKIIGPVNSQANRLAKKHFEELGLKTVSFKSPLESEMAKVFSTTYYGWNIIFEKYVYDVCLKVGADYEQVYTKFNRIYNNGYEKTLPHVRRPVLKHMEGEIGGHCVIPNARIMQEWIEDKVSSLILSENEKARIQKRKK